MEKEVIDEEALHDKQNEILAELNQLEDRMRKREGSEEELSNAIDKVQMKMDLLKVVSQCKRRFVQCELLQSRESTPSSSSTRSRKKVLVLISNTVTTIIQVLEEQMLTIEPQRAAPIQEKIKLVKVGDEISTLFCFI